VRICILTKADTLSWTQHYVDAFRQRAEIITVGPGYDAKQIEDWDLGHLAHTLVPNDIEVDLEAGIDLREVLPDGWDPDLLVTIASGGVSLQVSIDTLPCPKAFITIDTWQSISDYVECQLYDFVFAAQRASVEYLSAVGGMNVFWLPLGCNPDAHYPVEVPRDHDVAFAGNVILPVHQHRNDLLLQLERSFSLHIASRVFRDELCQAMGRGKLAFNHSAVNEVNMRVFEAMAMGRPLVTNRSADLNGLSDLFADGEHTIMYDTADDLVQKVRYYLDHEDEREGIARAGYRLATTQHRYLDRVDALLAVVRDYVPGVGDGADHTLDPCADYVPFGAKKVVDVGLKLGPHVTALQRRGATETVGIGNTGGEVDVSNYMRVVSATDRDAWSKEAAVIVLDSTDLFGANCLDAIDRAYEVLGKGGTLIVRLTARDFSKSSGIANLNQLEAQFAMHGFHVTGCNVSDAASASVIVRARKRTRLLAEIVQESFALLPHVDQDGLARWAAAYGPHY